MYDAPMRLLAACLLTFSLLGCSTLRDEMNYAETAYQSARYDTALVWLEDLEHSVPSMGIDMRARFYFLRGMTAYRLERRDHALHYLALCRELAGEDNVALPNEWTQQMERLLTEMTPLTASYHARAARSPAEAQTTGAQTSGGEVPEEDSSEPSEAAIE